MKKIITFLITLHVSLFTLHDASAQWGCSCLPEGITFTTQAQIDSFQINYPGCVEILGDVVISGNSITNLNGINVLTSIVGDLMMGYYFPDWGPIGGNHNLTNISALQNLNSLGGSLWICDNVSLNSLNGLENISTVENLFIIGNNSLSDLSGLDGITHVNGSLKIAEDSISTLEGLNNLTSVDDSLFIGIKGNSWVGPWYTGNRSLLNLGGLQNLTFLGGSLLFFKNESLIDLSGLDNLNGIGGSLIIGAGSNDNGSGGNPSLVNLSGLNSLDTIYGDLMIQGNQSLLNLNGLDNLKIIIGNFQIHGNNSLESLSGLNSLNSIDGFLQIGSGGYSNNSVLTSLTGLESLTSIDGDFSIVENDSLTNLNGLDNLTFIGGGLNICYNSSLSACDAQWLCDYLAEPNGAVNIVGNEGGCNNIIGVAFACGGVPCLPYGNYSFNSQSDIDLFQAAFPNCTVLQGNVTIAGNDITDLSGLSAVNSIGGSLSLSNNDSLTNLNGLEVLTSIGGLSILGNEALSSLTGLDNVTSIGGDLIIWGWNDLTSLSGLGSLTSIGGSLKIGVYLSTIKLESLSGLDNLTSIGGTLDISETRLTSLTGLDKLVTIGGGLDFDDNHWLISLTGLESLTSIGSDLKITYNRLESLSGPDNLTFIGGDLSISSNSSLSTCDAQWLCDYLAAPNGVVNIGGNASGCNNVIEVAYACGNMPCLPYGNYGFNSQSDIDLFTSAFPNCTALQGDVRIAGNDITNLSGLSAVKSIGGSLSLIGNDALTNLNGLEGLTSIGADFQILSNNALSSLGLLENLTFIGGVLRIRGSSPGGNGNPSLTSLSGLDNIDAFSLTGIDIRNNSSLATCEVQSICDYLVAPNGSVIIQYNAPGCDSEEEVEAACLVGVEESAVSGRQSTVRAFPNPFSEIVHIEYEIENPSPVSIMVFNVMGEKVADLSDGILAKGLHQITWNAAELPPGIYFYQLRAKSIGQVAAGKIMKH